ncbi:MAG TPA: hypothetical protein VK308_15670 [Pyrinomonadaceae bacterium]|nr:hypothetical protein [Pyrinomonadaceae bacterium]
MPLDGLFPKTEIKPITLESFRREDKPFLIVSYGIGRDSTGLLVLMAQLGIKPDLILHSNTGSEKDATVAYLPVINNWLRSVGFPEVTVINASRTRDKSIESHLFRLGIFAGLTYNKHNCSVIWKIENMDRFLKTYAPVIEAKKQGRIICRAVGFVKGEEYRAVRSDANAIGETTDEHGCKQTTAFAVNPNSEYVTIFPLIERNVDFDTVLELICREDLPIPKKSSCVMCAAMTVKEIYELSQEEPHNFFRCLVLERVVQRNQVVKASRIMGIAYGKKWSDFECAMPYEDRIEEVIELFGLDRAVSDGEANRRSTGWMKKAARVELFRECFGNAANLRAFMSGEMDMTDYAEKVREINHMDTGERQMELPL